MLLNNFFTMTYKGRPICPFLWPYFWPRFWLASCIFACVYVLTSFVFSIVERRADVEFCYDRGLQHYDGTEKNVICVDHKNEMVVIPREDGQ